jgi:hypothetical protein
MSFTIMQEAFANLSTYNCCVYVSTAHISLYSWVLTWELRFVAVVDSMEEQKSCENVLGEKTKCSCYTPGPKQAVSKNCTQ